MRDSWIDKEEVEQLAGSFRPSKKGSRHRAAAGPRKKVRSVSNETAATKALPTPLHDSPPESSLSTELAEEVPTPSVAGDLPSEISLPGEVNAGPAFSNGESAGTLSAPEAAIVPVTPSEVVGKFSEEVEIGLPPPLMWEFPVPTDEGGGREAGEPPKTEMIHSLFQLGDSEPAFEPLEEEVGLDEAEECSREEWGEPPHPESDSGLIAPFLPAGALVETVENLVDADPPDESAIIQRAPQFFDDDSDSEEWRVQSVSQRDADRALIALAEARAKVDKSQLMNLPPVLHAAPVEIVSVGLSVGAEEAIELIEPIEKESAIEVESAIESQLGVEPEPEPESLTSPLATSELELESLIPERADDGPQVEAMFESKPELPFVFEPSGVFHERIEQYGECAMRELTAREVAICDRDGLLLFCSPATSGEGSLETPLLVAVSEKISRLFGFEGAVATQVADGKGGWRCLLAGAAEDVFAGFTLDEPLDYVAIETWTKALAEAVNPAHRSY